ncbi:MAG: dihydropyrimidinase [Deltaproteobacteria bacterium]|nr:dihydropyrimidinase [Deltaproteobacteria bacterium]
MSKAKLIRQGRIVTATEDFTGDVLVRDGKIVAVGQDLKAMADGAEVVDAKGLLVIPGGIDAHTHLDLPFMGTSSSDDFETGTIAAANGGTTSIIDFAIQSLGKSMGDALNVWHEKAAGKAVVDYAFHMAVTDLNDRTIAEVPGVIEGGVTSFKTFMAYKGALMVDDGQLFRLMEVVKKLGGIVTMHAENAELIETLVPRFLKEGKTDPVWHERAHTAIGEGEATNRAISLSRVAGHPCYIVHLTCDEALHHVKDSLTRHRHPVFAETCPQYLLLDREIYEKPNFEGAKWVMSPPLRTKNDQEALWAGIRDGFIQTIATDHCPFNFHGQKDVGKGNFAKIPNGAPGIENRMNLMYTYGVLENRISLNRFVQLMSTNPAKIFGMYPQKGTIAPGSDADIVLFDPKKENTISVKTSKQRCDYSSFEGFKTKGEPVAVMSRGEWLLKEGKITAPKGHGKFVKRARFTGTSEMVR